MLDRTLAGLSQLLTEQQSAFSAIATDIGTLTRPGLTPVVKIQQMYVHQERSLAPASLNDRKGPEAD